MQKQGEIRRGLMLVIFTGIAAVIVVLDQITKSLIQTHIPLGGSVPPTGFFRFIHTTNTGASFGIFQNTATILAVISMVCLVILVIAAMFVYRRFPPRFIKASIYALAFVFGGTIGNMLDRITVGHVVDFIQVSIFPAFNIADAAISCGVLAFACFCLYLMRTERA